MNVLINGSSVSRGPGSWPYQIQDFLQQQPINLSQSAAGVSYIFETTIEELAKRRYDLVLIMWPPFDRYELRVSDVSSLSGTQYTSQCQKKMNDWPEKKIYPINDQDYVDDNWVFGAGYQFNDANDEVTRRNLDSLFQGYFTHVGYHSQSIMALTKMIALQSVLKSQSMPYVFGWNRLYRRQERFQYLYDMIDWDKFVNQDLLSIAKQLGDFDADGIHPGLSAHEQYGKLMIDKINSLYPALLGS